MKRKFAGTLLSYFVLLLFALIMLFPFYWMFVSSFKSGSEIVHRPPSLLPTDFSFSNYTTVFDSVPIGKYLINSVLVAVSSLVVTLYTTITGAFALSKLKLPCKHIILSILIALMMVPYELLTVSNYTTIVNLHLNDTLLALSLPFMSSIFYTLLLKNFFDGIPSSLYYSVMIDGGNDWRYLWKVLVPLSKPVLISISLFNIISSWNSFMWPLLIIKTQDKRTVTFGIYSFINEGGEHFELMMALSVIVILPMVIVFFIMRKHLIRGVSYSSKGSSSYVN